MFLNILKSILIMSLLTACGGLDDIVDDNTDEGQEEPSRTSSNENNDDGRSSLTEEEENQNEDENNVQESNDKVAPIITISGDNPLVISQGETFSDPGATATDDVDGVITVTPTGSVDMSTAGDYTITYTATDKAGNKTTATRAIIVKSASVVWNVSTMTEFRQALEDASANGENDKIVLSKGTYDVTSDGLGTLEFSDNEAFDLTIEALEGLTNKDVILSGNHSTQIFSFNNSIRESLTLTFKNISVIDGNNTESKLDNDRDMYAIYMNLSYSDHRIKIEGCNISNNQGGFFSEATTIITNSTISNNGGSGFASYYGPVTVSNSTISNNAKSGFFTQGRTTVTDSTISHNTGSGFGSASATVTNSTISHNTGRGGFRSGGTTIVTNSTISDNMSSSYGGGGFSSDGTTTVTNSTINNNTSSDGGGGFSSDGTTTITNSTINNNTNNSSRNGGGFSSDGTTTITNSTISNNTSNGKGTRYGGHSGGSGGGFTINDGDSLIINSSTISNNTAKYSGGAFFSYVKKIIVINSIFSENNATEGAIFSISSYHTSYYISNNTFIKNKGSIFGNGIFVNNIFSENDEDISLNGESKIYNNYIDYYKIEDNNENVIKKKNLQPASVGEVSLTATNGLTSSSPVIDKGLNPSSATYRKIIDNNDTYNQIIELLKTDNVGNKRVHNGTIDMGAVEYGSGK